MQKKHEDTELNPSATIHIFVSLSEVPCSRFYIQLYIRASMPRFNRSGFKCANIWEETGNQQQER